MICIYEPFCGGGCSGALFIQPSGVLLQSKQQMINHPHNRGWWLEINGCDSSGHLLLCTAFFCLGLRRAANRARCWFSVAALNSETQTSRLLVGQTSRRTAMAAGPRAVTVLGARVTRHCSEVWIPCDFLTTSIPDEWGSSPSFVFSSESIQGFTRRNGSKNSHFLTKKINIWNI